MTFQKLLHSFAGKRVIVIGDVMIDTYVWGDVERISPESPVPIVMARTTEHRLGGAANVGLNIKGLGAQPILISVVGEDDKGRQFVRMLEENGLDGSHIIQSPSRMTTEKTRILSRNQQMLRVDHETTEPIDEAESDAIIARVKAALPHADVLIFQDYDKGVLTEKVISEVLALCHQRQVPTAVDPKRRNFFAYRGATLFKPNLRELNEAMSARLDGDLQETQLASQASELEERLGNRVTLITLASQGIFYHDDERHFLSPAFKARSVSDVSGAGDTVISIAALCLATDVAPEDMCRLANMAAGFVCEQPGVVPITTNELLQLETRTST
jgi:rfaE bifunctional protein kinase chain/domain